MSKPLSPARRRRRYYPYRKGQPLSPTEMRRLLLPKKRARHVSGPNPFINLRQERNRQNG